MARKNSLTIWRLTGLVGVLVTSVLYGDAQGETPITKSNWQQHPKIVAIRHLVQKITDDERKGLLTVRKRQFASCQPGADVLRVLATTPTGSVVRYERQGGSEDSALTFQHYYDATDGRVRFIFIHGGATNGSQVEHRIYFDAAGKRLWEDQRYTAGPGYPFPLTWPEDELQKNNPQAAFDAASPCQAAPSATSSTTARKGPSQVAVPSDLWLGRYTFGEDGGKTAGGSIIYVAHILTVARREGKLVATLESNGYQTSRHIICQAVVTGNRLEILFQQNNPEEPSLFEEFAKDDRLFTLERVKRGTRWVILTHWGKFTGSVRDWPSGRVYFAKESGSR